MLVREVAGRLVVVSADEAARGAGIHPGMPLAQARACCARVDHAEHDPQGDRAALLALARWMLRFTPVVGILDDAPVGEGYRPAPASDVSPHPRHAALRVARIAQGERLFHGRVSRQPGAACPPAAGLGLALDLGGCERLFGGIEPIVRQMDDAFRRFGIGARLGVAPTVGAAWAISLDPRRHGAILEESDLPGAIDPLPPVALRLPAEVVASLRHVGIDSVSILRQLPRERLPARFGPLLLRRLDQALGRVPEPIVAVEPFRSIERRVEFEHVVASLEPMLRTLDRELEVVAAELRRRGRGARRLTLALLRPGGRSATLVVSLARASRDRDVLSRLCRRAIEDGADRLGLRRRPSRRGAARRRRETVVRRASRPWCDDAHDDPGGIEYVDDGFVGIRVAVDRSEPIIERQVELSGHDDVDRLAEERARLVEGLSQALGQERVLVARTLPAFLPEKSFRLEPALGADGAEVGASRGLAVVLPLTLLPEPREARVVVAPSHDRDGRPVWIDFDRRGRAVVHCFGPARIAGEWWHGHLKTRDYFEIEDEQARRLWVFRVPETGRWFVHGRFG